MFAPTNQQTALAARIAALLAVAALLLTAHQLGIFRQFADPAGVKRALLLLGPWGHLAFVAAYASLQPFGFPAMAFYLAAPLIWPWPLAFGLTLGGSMGASLVGFLFARFVARDWVAARIPARLRRHEQALARRAFSTVFLLRSVFWMSSPLHAFLGISQIHFSTHFWASLAAYILPLFLIARFGEGLFELARTLPLTAWLALAAALAAIALVVWRLRPPASPTPP